jgi:hypothetical protein
MTPEALVIPNAAQRSEESLSPYIIIIFNVYRVLEERSSLVCLSRAVNQRFHDSMQNLNWNYKKRGPDLNEMLYSLRNKGRSSPY